MSQTPEERMDQLKAFFADPQISDRDKLAYAYHAVLLEWGFWRRNRVAAFVEKHGGKLNDRIDIANWVKRLEDFDG